MRLAKIMLPILFIVFVIGLPETGAESTKSGAYSVDGNYQVIIKPDHYPDYSTMVTITKVDAQNIKINGTYDGIPLTARGVLRNGASSVGIDTYDVKVSNGFFSGKIVLSFRPQDKGCQISGFGRGSYNYLGRSGSAAAVITGVKSKVNFNSSTTLLALLIIGTVIMILWFSRRREPTRK